MCVSDYIGHICQELPVVAPPSNTCSSKADQQQNNVRYMKYSPHVNIIVQIIPLIYIYIINYMCVYVYIIYKGPSFRISRYAAAYDLKLQLYKYI